MKYTFNINQAGVVHCGLAGRVSVLALCVLDYLSGWFRYKNAKRVTVGGSEFVWLHYEHAIEELPILFSSQATVATLKNQLSRIVRVLRKAGLVESVKVGRDLYLRPSDLASKLTNFRAGTVTKSAPTVTPLHDDTVTLLHDDTGSCIMYESGTSETTIRNQYPHSPPKGDCVRVQSSCTSTQAEEIYAAYPKQAAKPAALSAIRRALKRHPAAFLLERTKLYATTYTGNPQYIPHPATWFNNARFADDPATWRSTVGATGKAQPAILRPGQFGTGLTTL